MSASSAPTGQGDLNNTSAMRTHVELEPDAAYLDRSLAISASEDDAEIRATYRPFLLEPEVAENDWVAKLELSTALKMAEEDLRKTGQRVRILMLYGSLRTRSYSKLLTYEAARILHRLGADVRIFSSHNLPLKDDISHNDAKVQELRSLSKWSDGHVWISPEQHGQITGIIKNQIDWIPLSTGSVRPTQGRTLAVAQVSGGSQSFNSVNTLRILGRWMRMFVVPNQSSVPMAYTQFTDADEVDGREEGDQVGLLGGSRMLPSGNRDRLVDCMEELVKYTIVMRQGFDLFGDRFSEREEKRRKQRSAAEKEERMRKEQELKVEQVEKENVKDGASTDVGSKPEAL
ncbi:hypothetical protein AAFC00_002813 [Neodothiora populina]|uniref:NADPH-dependent FMN reductase-like domain-containing protein n=1 Tax=Neodothiora populina TaxID=2781224 RepID=A0ABR3P8R3_9PEZI